MALIFLRKYVILSINSNFNVAEEYKILKCDRIRVGEVAVYRKTLCINMLFAVWSGENGILERARGILKWIRMTKCN